MHGRLEELEGEHVYDRIVSGLPLNNFAASEVEQILKVFARLIKPDGVLSFFEYIAMRRVKQMLSRGSERRRLREISRLFGDLTKQHEIRCDWVWLNVTPAWVHHVQVSEPAAKALNTKTQRRTKKSLILLRASLCLCAFVVRSVSATPLARNF